MIECTVTTPWGYHPELRGDRCNRCGFVAREGEDSVESRVERVPPAVRITHVFEDRDKATRFETEPFTGYE